MLALVGGGLTSWVAPKSIAQLTHSLVGRHLSYLGFGPFWVKLLWNCVYCFVEKIYFICVYVWLNTLWWKVGVLWQVLTLWLYQLTFVFPCSWWALQLFHALASTGWGSSASLNVQLWCFAADVSHLQTILVHLYSDFPDVIPAGVRAHGLSGSPLLWKV